MTSLADAYRRITGGAPAPVEYKSPERQALEAEWRAARDACDAAGVEHHRTGVAYTNALDRLMSAAFALEKAQ